MFTTIELFAGAGGLALGIEKAGFKTLALNEFNADACATLRKNRPNWNVIEGDVAEISGLDLEEYYYPVEHLVKLFPMPVKNLDWKMQEERYFIIMQRFWKNYSPRCFYLKMYGAIVFIK